MPPPVIWRNTLGSTREVSERALTYRFEPVSNQRSWAEVPFGMPDRKARDDLVWSNNSSVAFCWRPSALVLSHLRC
jgi:hypothetical protein